MFHNKPRFQTCVITTGTAALGQAVQGCAVGGSALLLPGDQRYTTLTKTFLAICPNRWLLTSVKLEV
uniref:Uncharacterized protein n=1 Tax=Romanomermis culicivorax TaxID=13658 RepID=A0A915JE03_ROMCU